MDDEIESVLVSFKPADLELLKDALVYFKANLDDYNDWAGDVSKGMYHEDFVQLVLNKLV